MANKCGAVGKSKHGKGITTVSKILKFEWYHI